MPSRKCGVGSVLTGMALAAVAAALAAGCGGDEPLGSASGAPAPHSKPPNVVFIVLDALRADRLGCYGFPKATSPELDALTAQGVLFERVVAQCSWTRPSVGSMLTGQYPRALGLYKEIGESLPRDAESLAELLKAQGYTTIGATATRLPREPIST